MPERRSCINRRARLSYQPHGRPRKGQCRSRTRLRRLSILINDSIAASTASSAAGGAWYLRGVPPSCRQKLAKHHGQLCALASVCIHARARVHNVGYTVLFHCLMHCPTQQQETRHFCESLSRYSIRIQSGDNLIPSQVIGKCGAYTRITVPGKKPRPQSQHSVQHRGEPPVKRLELCVISDEGIEAHYPPKSYLPTPSIQIPVQIRLVERTPNVAPYLHHRGNKILITAASRYPYGPQPRSF